MLLLLSAIPSQAQTEVTDSIVMALDSMYNAMPDERIAEGRIDSTE